MSCPRRLERWYYIAITLLVVVAIALPCSADTPKATVRFVEAPGPLDNPLKGWCTYTFPTQLHQPYSFVYQETSWKQLEPKDGDFEFDAWEKHDWDTPLCAGKHCVLRVYLDYPSLPTGVPDWIMAKGVKTRAYSDYGGGASPDYDNPYLLAGLLKLIAAMGKRYDHDPRVAFVELGVLGFWGEWHTYPHSDWFASDETQLSVVNAFHQAFPDKILMARYPKGDLGTENWLGYFDDFFPGDTNQPIDWNFMPTMRASGRQDNWRHAAIGGEMEPGAAKKWLGGGFATTMDAISAAHFTWVGPYNPGMEADSDPSYIARSQQMVRMMGYQYCLQQMTFTTKVKVGASASLQIDGINQGVAPFYYPWKVELALIDHGAVAQVIPLVDDIRTWLPGDFRINDRFTVRAKPGRYQLAIGIVDPMTDRPDIKFANTLPYSAGWTVLSDVEVTR